MSSYTNLRMKIKLIGMLALGTVLITIFGGGKAIAIVPYVNARISISSGGSEGNNYSNYASISKDGRFISFKSKASNLVTGDSNNKEDIFVRDTSANTTVRVSISSSGTEANGDSVKSRLSSDGRYVIFESEASNLVSGDSNSVMDVFLHDLQNSTTEVISKSTGGTLASNYSEIGDVSRGGRYVVFSSIANNLVSGDTGNTSDVFIRDRKTSTTTRLSVDSSGAQGNSSSITPVISCDGAFVAFASNASNLTPSDTNAVRDIFMWDRTNSVMSNITSSGNGDSLDPFFACNGDSISFISTASNLVTGDTNGFHDAFVYDVIPETTTRISIATGGTQGNSSSSKSVTLSANGQCAIFDSNASNLVGTDTNSTSDIFVHDRSGGVTERLTMRTSSQETGQVSEHSTVSDDGKYAAYHSNDTGLVSGDTNSNTDVFISETGMSNCAL